MRGLTLSIVDDGIGFDVDSAWGAGLGLVSMRERLDAIGGALEIHSQRGAGTRLKVWAPLPAAEARMRPQSEYRGTRAGLGPLHRLSALPSRAPGVDTLPRPSVPQ